MLTACKRPAGRITRAKSTGRAGEAAAQLWFRSHGWTMFPVAPPSRVVGYGANLKVIYIGKGYPDFWGHFYPPASWQGYDSTQPMPVYCEVKEAKPCEGDSVPASRLTATQRAFMAALPEGTAYVLILWRSGEFEMFPFVNRGSYKKSTGIK